MAERAVKARRHRPMVMVDLAVPRDIEPEIGGMDDVFLYTVDDLAQVVDAGLESRQQAVVEAEQIIDDRVDGFLQWMAASDVVPTIRSLREQADAARQAELERALRLLRRGEDPGEVMAALAHRLTNKLIHGPSRYLNQAEGERRAEAAALVGQLLQRRRRP
jgi:glutamyl-tRNA reductase